MSIRYLETINAILYEGRLKFFDEKNGFGFMLLEDKGALIDLFVYKNDDADKTVSYIKKLESDERVTEIAKMLSTGNPTQSAMVNAKELLNTNQKV